MNARPWTMNAVSRRGLLRGATASLGAFAALGPRTADAVLRLDVTQGNIQPIPASQIVTKKFGDLAEGPYKRLVIRNAMVIPGYVASSAVTRKRPPTRAPTDSCM